MHETKYQLDNELFLSYMKLTDLQAAFDKFVKPSLFRKPSVSNIVDFLERVSLQRSNFWWAVYAKWPELKGKNLSATSIEITVGKEVE